jgi:hypothetical protein
MKIILIFAISLLVYISFKLPTSIILNILGLYYIYPIIAGLSACLIFILKKGLVNNSFIVLREVLIVFFFTIIISYLMLMVNYFCYDYIVQAFDIMLLPLYITISVTPDGFTIFTLNMDNKGEGSSTGNSKSSHESIVEKWDALDQLRETVQDLRGVKKQLLGFIEKMAEVQSVHDIKVIKTGFITSIDVPNTMSDSEVAMLEKRVNIISNAFDSQCDKFTSIADKALQLKQDCIRLGAEPDKGFVGLVDNRVNGLAKIKQSYNNIITIEK